MYGFIKTETKAAEFGPAGGAEGRAAPAGCAAGGVAAAGGTAGVAAGVATGADGAAFGPRSAVTVGLADVADAGRFIVLAGAVRLVFPVGLMSFRFAWLPPMRADAIGGMEGVGLVLVEGA